MDIYHCLVAVPLPSGAPPSFFSFPCLPHPLFPLPLLPLPSFRCGSASAAGLILPSLPVFLPLSAGNSFRSDLSLLRHILWGSELFYVYL